MRYASFWDTLQQPIIALAPMDGVTDAPNRTMHGLHGRPDVVLTEFTNVEGLWRGSDRIFRDFLYTPAERPVVAQIFGCRPEYFYKAAHVVCELGFDGVDINMGCPARTVANHGGGAALIRVPDTAKAIIRATQQGVRDWANGQTLEDLGMEPERIEHIRQMNIDRVARWGDTPQVERRLLPVSVKTRLGYDSVIIEDWVKVLLEVEPVAISLHGRTLRQMYTGSADWDAIGRAAEIVRQTPTLILGNGDIHSPEDVLRRLRQTGVHGVLIGRASMGNPWLFRDIRAALAAQPTTRPNATERLLTALQHVRLFSALLPNHRFVELRKHLSWYCRDFFDAVALRRQLVQTNSLNEVEQMIGEALERGVGEREPVGAVSAVDSPSF